MNIFTRHRVLILGLALILLTNIVVIAGALGNRSGEPECVLTLTERELPRRNWRRENSGLSLQLNWNGSYTVGRDWLDIEKLSELGFKPVDTEDRRAVIRYVEKTLPKSVYIVLEFNGTAYQNAVREAEETLAEESRVLSRGLRTQSQVTAVQNAERNLDRLKNSASRLYAIDAGLDPGVLREQYEDTSRYIIAGGLLRLNYTGFRNSPEPYRGHISQIDVTRIHVPLQHREVLDKLSARRYPRDFNSTPRYQVELAYGNRYEPWLRGAGLIEE